METRLKILDDQRVLVDYGPITMTISAQKDKIVNLSAAQLGGSKAIADLDCLAEHLAILKQPIAQIPDQISDLAILNKMIAATKLLKDNSFTPLVCVAGAFSDTVVNHIKNNSDCDYIIANNGGDIAFYLANNQIFKVGIIDDLAQRVAGYGLTINNTNQIGGIATSGLGGRSLTKGIASAVTVLAANAIYADAAATYIANHTVCKSEQISYCLAEQLAYDTDIKGQYVVNAVGNLSVLEIEQSLHNGYMAAQRLYDLGLIKAAFIFVKGQLSIYPPLSDDYILEKRGKAK